MTTTNSGGLHREKVSLSTVLRLVVLLVVVVMIGGGVGFAGSLLLPEQYAARAEIEYKLSKSVPNELLREDRTLTTQKVLLHSMVVLRPVAEQNQIAPEDLAKNISADVVANSEVIAVELRAETRERAQVLLAAVLHRYLVEANRDWKDPVREYLDAQITDLQYKLQEVQKKREPDISPERAAELDQQEKVLYAVLDHTRQELSNAPQQISEPPARLLIAPYTESERVRPRPLLNAAAGAAAALVLSSLVVLFIARRRLRL
jgi:capsular polysaccharide biosynthesis protein